jgi:hypothetical protein
MNFEQIKQLTLNDFIASECEVWAAIKNLSINQIEDLLGTWPNDAIENDLYAVICEKSEQLFKQEVIDRLTFDQQKALNYLCFDKDSMWDSFRKWTD